MASPVLVGGLSANGDRHHDAWEYAPAGAWGDVSPGSFPSARFVRATYDATRGQVVLFGGYGKSGTVLDDTWIFDGTRWGEPMLSAPSPLTRYDQQLTYDAARERVVHAPYPSQSSSLISGRFASR